MLIRIPGRASFFDHLVAERDAFRIVLLEPFIGKFWRREYLEVVDVANFLAGIDVDPNGCRWSLLCDGSDRRRSRAKDRGLTVGGRSGGVVKQTHLNPDGGPLQNAKGGR